MEPEIKKPARQRRRHDSNTSSHHQSGGGGFGYGVASFKPVHGAVADDIFGMGVSDTRFSPTSPQGPDPYSGVLGVSPERRIATARGTYGRHGGAGQFGVGLPCNVPNGPIWSHMSASSFPTVPSGTSDVGDFGGVAFDDDIVAASDISSHTVEAGANSLGFLIGDDGIETEQDQHLKSLLDLARENLTLKQQLKTANQELSRLQDAVQKHQSERHLRKQKQLEQESQSRYWTLDEHHKFLEAIENFGPKDVKAIATFVGSRSATQVRTHAQKYFMKLAREKSVQSGGDADNGNSSSEATEEASRSSSMLRRGASNNNGRSGDESLVPSKASSRSPLSSGGDAAEDSSQSRSSRGSSCGPNDPRGSSGGAKSSETSGSDGCTYAGIKVEGNNSPAVTSSSAGGRHQRNPASAAARGGGGGRKRAAAAAQAEGPSDDDVR